MKKLIQQGDVLVFAVSEIPSDAKKVLVKDSRGIVLAEGEATGHAHTIDRLDLCEMFQDSANNLWLSVTGEGVVVHHQEHKAVEIPKGKYKIGIVREVDPFAEEIRKVTD